MSAGHKEGVSVAGRHNGGVSETSSTSRSGNSGLPLPDFLVEILVALVPLTALVVKGAGWSLPWVVVVPACFAIAGAWAWWHLRRRSVRRPSAVRAADRTAGERERREAAATLARTLAAAMNQEARETAAAVRLAGASLPATYAEEARRSPAPRPDPGGLGTPPPPEPARTQAARGPATAAGLDDFDPGEATRT